MGRRAALNGGKIQRLVVRTRATLGGSPIDDLVRIFDVARFAMHAVCGIDLQTLATLPVLDHFVDVGGAEAGAGVGILGCASGGADRSVQYLQVRRLVL